MKVLVFDTETTGLPKRYAKYTDTHEWPHIIQISYIYYDTDTHNFTVFDHIIKLDPVVVVSEKSIEIHKITKEISQEKGVSIKQVLHEFIALARHADYVIGHNLQFDKNMVIVECIRNRVMSPFLNKTFKEYCTMKQSVDICRLNSKNNYHKYKYPKLEELHWFLFNILAKNLHNSLCDVIVTLRCFYMLIFKEDLYIVNEKIRPFIESIQ